MRTIFLYLLIITLGFGLAVSEASAKRFGGGRSFGVQRSHNSLFSSHAPQTSKSFGQQPSPRKWGGILGGLLAGGLLASLFMGHGLGTGLLSWLVLGSLTFFLVGFIRKKFMPSFQAAPTSAFRQSHVNKPSEFFASNSVSNASNDLSDFDQESFLREAKVTFIRLQAAYDQKNRQDLSEFTAPEVFAEIDMQIKERGGETNKTEVFDLSAQLLNASKQAEGMIASVRFTGTIQENKDLLTELNEIWHFRQFSDKNSWVVGGIQQEVVEAG